MSRDAVTRHGEKISEAMLALKKACNETARDMTRCKYHFMAPSGWINDPNGLILYRGEYHLFYQHNPFAAQWGPMYWGHAVSPDLVRWRHLPVALAPSEPYEKGGGCFSGSAAEYDGKLHLFYTAALHDRETGKSAQTQCHAESIDGAGFTKNPVNPLISDPPEGCHPGAFRDPKVWFDGGRWHMLVGGSIEQTGQAFLYRSADMKTWHFHSVLAKSDGTLGSMWECPDFFPLGGRHVLLFSPMGLGKRSTMYLVGDFDQDTCAFHWDRSGVLDWGDEFYAPQSLCDKQSDRVVFGWMNTWGLGHGQPTMPKAAGKSWCGSMSVPRVLRLLPDGSLSVTPHESLRSLRGDLLAEGEGLPGNAELIAREEGAYELDVVFEPAGNDAVFGLRFGCDESGNAAARLVFDMGEGAARLTRPESGYYRAGTRQASGILADRSRLAVRAFVDGPMVGLFINDGAACLSGHADPEALRRGVCAFAEAGAVRIASVRAYRMQKADPTA